MDFGFVVLCPDGNVGGLKNTLGSIYHYSYGRESICVVPDGTIAKREDVAKPACKMYEGKNTITSLINTGMKNIEHEWAFLLFSGSRIMPYLERRLSHFVKDEGDIIFPVVNRKWNFVEGSFNGVMLNKSFFDKVGEFPAGDLQKNGVNDFELAKLVWALAAMKAGCTFKAIVGLRII